MDTIILLSPQLGGMDYFLTPIELTFPADSQQGDVECVDVEIIDDEAVETYEYI